MSIGELEDVIQTARIFFDYENMVRCQDLPDITTMCYLLKAKTELENKYGLDFERRYNFYVFY